MYAQLLQAAGLIFVWITVVSKQETTLFQLFNSIIFLARNGFIYIIPFQPSLQMRFTFMVTITGTDCFMPQSYATTDRM